MRSMTAAERWGRKGWGALVVGVALLVAQPGEAWGQQAKPDGAALVEAMRLNNESTKLYREGKIDASIPSAERALALVEKALGPDRPDVASLLNNLALRYEAKGDYGKAEPLYQRALAIQEKTLRPDHPNVAMSLNNLAELYTIQGDYGKAEPLYQRSLAIREKALGPDHPHVATSLISSAIMYLARGDVARAIPRMERAAAVDDRNAAAQLSGSDEQRRAYMTTLAPSDIYVSLHVQFAPSVQAARELALATILNRKERVLDAMADGSAALRRRLTPAKQAKLDAWRSTSAAYSALALRGPDTSTPGDYRKTLEEIDKKRQELEAEVIPLSPELQAALLPVTVKRVQAAIPEGAALVELFLYFPFNPKVGKPDESVGEARYVAYVLPHQGDITWADLGEAKPIEEAIEAFLPTLRRAAADPKPAARALDALVMQPIRRLLGDTRRVFLSPDGELSLVPFAALRDEDGHYLVERYALTYLASGRDLLRFASTSSSRQGPVVIAAPNYWGTDLADDKDIRSYKPLSRAIEEGRAVHQKLEQATLLVGPEATEGAVKALRGPSLLHLATHGFFQPDPKKQRAPALDGTGQVLGMIRPLIYTDNPLLRSGLVFAGANRPQGANQDDGLLTALEASQLDLGGTKLVVMSACETGMGEARSGEGVYGLRRALAMAGAETQVMSLWRVDSTATREQMEAYYDGLLQGQGRSEAMRQVQLAMLARPERSHPYYWASFIVSGNPAALDRKALTPDFGRVGPGLRGCSCEVGGSSPANPGVWAAVLAMLALGRRRRSAPRSLREPRTRRPEPR